MARFLFTETSHRLNGRNILVDVEPANAEPEGFEAATGGLTAAGWVRKYELLDENGCQQAFVSYRERSSTAPTAKTEVSGGEGQC